MNSYKRLTTSEVDSFFEGPSIDSVTGSLTTERKKTVIYSKVKNRAKDFK